MDITNIFSGKEFKVYKNCLAIILLAFLTVSISAQTHLSVPLGHPVYNALEQAQMRGLIDPLPRVKPYSQERILKYIDDILDNDETRRFGGLTNAERAILEQFKKDFTPSRDGLNLLRGTYSTEHIWNDVYFSSEFGFGLDMLFSGSYFPVAGGFKYIGEIPENTDNFTGFEGAVHPASEDTFSSYNIMPSLSFKGDLGRDLSYGLTIGIWAGKSPRTVMGSYRNIRDPVLDRDDELEMRYMTAYSQPLAFFPYTYKKRWDGYVWTTGEFTTGGMRAWPEGDVSLGYTMMPEMAGAFFNGHLTYRFARIDREWSGMSPNGSLLLNQSAQPFLAFETTITPFKWISFSSLTGVLEYHNAVGEIGYGSAGIQETAESFQNAYSIVMLELNYENFFYVNFGSSVVWPKRFELGYIFPFADNFIYQTNIGDFDNMALFFNFQAQYPGVGRVWLSVFIDEMSPAREFFTMSRMMHAYQFGGSLHLPWMPFSSVTISYTKIEPYNYTHIRENVPWFDNPRMETNYVNFGTSLGHYIPPNSDELLIRFETMPAPKSLLSLQYQLIRHGADYGNRAVPGSSLWSELLIHGRHRIRKYFLRDGAYQWMNILKIGGEYSLTNQKIPVRAFGEFGGIYSYFTDVEPDVRHPGRYSIVNTPQYPQKLILVGTIGLQIFPKF